MVVMVWVFGVDGMVWCVVLMVVMVWVFGVDGVVIVWW